MPTISMFYGILVLMRSSVTTNSTICRISTLVTKATRLLFRLKMVR